LPGTHVYPDRGAHSHSRCVPRADVSDFRQPEMKGQTLQSQKLETMTQAARLAVGTSTGAKQPCHSG
jgi:hypothetical protein